MEWVYCGLNRWTVWKTEMIRLGSQGLKWIKKNKLHSKTKSVSLATSQPPTWFPMILRKRYFFSSCQTECACIQTYTTQECIQQGQGHCPISLFHSVSSSAPQSPCNGTAKLVKMLLIDTKPISAAVPLCFQHTSRCAGRRQQHSLSLNKLAWGDIVPDQHISSQPMEHNTEGRHLRCVCVGGNKRKCRDEEILIIQRQMIKKNKQGEDKRMQVTRPHSQFFFINFDYCKNIGFTPTPKSYI